MHSVPSFKAFSNINFYTLQVLKSSFVKNQSFLVGSKKKLHKMSTIVHPIIPPRDYLAFHIALWPLNPFRQAPLESKKVMRWPG